MVNLTEMCLEAMLQSVFMTYNGLPVWKLLCKQDQIISKKLLSCSKWNWIMKTWILSFPWMVSFLSLAQRRRAHYFSIGTSVVFGKLVTWKLKWPLFPWFIFFFFFFLFSCKLITRPPFISHYAIIWGEMGPFLTFLVSVLQRGYLYQNGVDFSQKMIGAGLNLFWGHFHYSSGGIRTFSSLSDTWASAPIAERAI